MKHEIDLTKYQIRTDLAIEAVSFLDTFTKDEYDLDNIHISKITLDEESAKKINKKPGKYITIEFEDVTDFNNRKSVKKVFSDHLKDLLKTLKISEESSCLIIGLGNSKSTPDSLGPLSIDNILVTNHLFMYGAVEEGFRKVSAIKPGVTGDTGIETSDLIKSIVESTKPDFLIVIDALASQAISRVNKTIQMSNTGIHPGSGVGNSRKEISEETLNIPVIAIGVPTVVDAVTVVSDTIEYMHKFYAFQKEFQKNPMSKLVTQINYLKHEIKVNEDEKKDLFGIIGHFDNFEIKQLISDVLTPIGYNLMVTPKEIDFLMTNLSDVIGNGINEALHKKVDN